MNPQFAVIDFPFRHRLPYEIIGYASLEPINEPGESSPVDFLHFQLSKVTTVHPLPLVLLTD